MIDSQSLHPPWHEVEGDKKPTPQPRILPKKQPLPLLTIIKKLWFPILLLPMTVLIIARIQDRKVTSELPVQLPFIPTQTQVPEDGLENWRTFRNEKDGFEFRYPASWVTKPILIRGSGYTQEFESQDGLYLLSFSSQSNYNQVAGKPYSTIDEVVGTPNTSRAVNLDGQEGRQPLPRSGSENMNSVVLFSKDLKFIYNLSLQTGDSPRKTTTKDMLEGKRIFNQILSTFAFLPKDCGECPQYSPPSSDFCKDGEIIPGERDACGCQQPPTCQQESPRASDGCVISGCNGELCADVERSSICLYRPEFICYKTASCERQKDGKCGWTQTAELTACLQNRSQ